MAKIRLSEVMEVLHLGNILFTPILPIEVIKLRLQNVEAMLKAESLDRPYGELLTAPNASLPMRALRLFGREMEPTSSDTSPPKPSTSLLKTTSRDFSGEIRRGTDTSFGFWAT
jgi:hypothetical protein